MVDYFCYKCGKKFTCKSNYNRHLNRQNSCAPIEDPFAELRKKIEEQQIQIDNLTKLLNSLIIEKKE